MRRICYICGLLFGLKEPYEDDRETHGECDSCHSIVMNNFKNGVYREISNLSPSYAGGHRAYQGVTRASREKGNATSVAESSLEPVMDKVLIATDRQLERS